MREMVLREDYALSEKARRNIAILEVLRRQGPISRPDISEKLGLNVVTISNYIDDFLKNNIVFEKQLDVSEGGRRPVLLDLNSKAAYAIGIGLNLLNVVGILIDLKGNIITKAQLDRPGTSVREITECLVEIARQVIKRSKEYTDKVRGIGVGIGGLIDTKDGSIHWPEKIDDNYTYASVNIPLKELLEKEFSLPVVIENDATAACFGEQWLGLEPNIENVIYMFSGVGCGIMIGGQIYRGANGCAGEVAIHNYRENQLFNCSLGNPCFLKRWEIDMGMVAELKKRLNADEQSAKEILRLAENDQKKIDLKTVLTAARMKNPLALEVLEITAKRLGIKIAYLVNLLNPQVVVIGGGLEEAGDEFLIQVNRTVKDWAFREVVKDLKITYSKLRENSVAQGAASLVIQRLFAKL